MAKKKKTSKRPKTNKSTDVAQLDSRELARRCARTADDFKARDVVVLDVEQAMGLTDCFVIATADSYRTIRGLAQAIEKDMAEHGLRATPHDNSGRSGWLLLDFGLLVVHLFDEDTRAFYDLEFLWSDAEQLDWKAQENETADERG